jgi:4-hydroxybenzoyl-CoA reductase alpha subunit
VTQFSTIGQRLPRVDAGQIVTGEAQYTVDISLPGMLTGLILRSPVPHARIISINAEKARALPGVLAVLTGEDTLKIKYGYRASSADEYGLAVEKVRYVGEQVAAVAALDGGIAEEALSLIEVNYQALPSVFDPKEAMKDGAPLVHDDVPGNISYSPCFHWGNVEEGFAKSDHVREDSFSTQPQIHCSMEPHAAVAQYAGGRLTLWSTTQGPYALRKELALTLGLEEGRIRVIKPRMGGGFGGKREMFASDFCAGLLAMKTGRPVKLVYSRTEEFIASRQRHPMFITVKTGFLKDGTIMAKDCVLVADGGAYNSRGPGILSYAGASLASLYRIPHVRYMGYHVYTNKPVGGAFRGYGSLQVRFADESQMDMIAEELGMDPLELRLKNVVEPGDTTISGRKITSCGIKECLQKVAEASGWFEKRGAKKKGYGIGIAANDYVSALRSIYEYDSSSALVRPNEDGTVDIYTGASDIGQGSDTTIAQIVAEELTIPFEKVNVVSADTQTGAMDLGTYASRVTFVAGNAAKKAAYDLKDQLFNHLSTYWSIEKEKLHCRGGMICVPGRDDLSMTIKEAVCRILNKEGHFVIGRGYYDAPSETVDYKTGYGNSSPAYSYGAQVAEVQVDYQTGQVRVIRVVAASDCGRVINPLGLEGQAEGSIVCGLGMTLLEDRPMEEGRTLNPNFLGYKIPTSMEAPDMESYPIETIDPEGPFGAKGVSEGYQVPTAPAIANAIYNATGIRFKKLPITPEEIVRAMKREGKDAL